MLVCTHRLSHTQKCNIIIFTHTKRDCGKAAPPAPFIVRLFIVKKTETKKHPPISEFISTRRTSICFQSPNSECTFTFWRNPPSQCWQITKKEKGSNWRLKPLISLEKVCTLLGGPEWPFADKTWTEETGAVDKWDIRIQQQEGMEENTDSCGWIYNHCTVSMLFDTYVSEEN